MGEGDAGALGIDDAEVGEMETTRLRAFFFMLVLLWSFSQYVECVYALGFVRGERRGRRGKKKDRFFLLFDFFWKSRLWLHITFTEAARLDERWCSGHRKAVEMNNNLQQLEARESIWVDYSAAKQQTLAGMINVCAARRMTQIERLCLEWRHCERVSLLTSSMVCKKSS